MHTALAGGELRQLLEAAPRILVVGAGKAGAAMAEGVEVAIPHCLLKVAGWINVPADQARPLRAIHLHPARPAAHNFPTSQGVVGTEQILRLVEQAGSGDVVLCLLSGGGSAALPAPVQGISLEDKQAVTQLLHASGATINEMNAVRKHLSRVKGGRLAQAFRGKALVSLIISDVIGDPLDVIASGPTAADPTTFADALAVLNRYGLKNRVPLSVLVHLHGGAEGNVTETPKQLPENVTNLILANNSIALAAAADKARQLGYGVVNLGAFLDGDTNAAANLMAAIVRGIVRDGQPLGPPACLLSGGETTMALVRDHGLGGRNQHFVLAMAQKLGLADLENVAILGGGTDGEDGPTDAAGAFADASTLVRAAERGLHPAAFLARDDSYHFFDATGGLFKPGPTQTNVMDIRVVLAG